MVYQYHLQVSFLLHAAKRREKSSFMAIQPVRILKIPLSGLTFCCALVWKVFGSHVPKADYVITLIYSKHLIQSYGVTTPMLNGIDLEKYKKRIRKKRRGLSKAF